MAFLSDEDSMALWSNRRGATLPLTLLVIALLSMIIVAGFNRASSERRVNANQEAQVDAFAVAQSGLEQYLSNVTSMPGVFDSTNVTGLPGGNAIVVLRQLRDTTGGRTAVYLISSRGISATAKKYDPKAPPAERTVAQYAIWRAATLDVDAAFTSLSGIDKNGKSGTFSGNDTCHVSPPIPGVAVPNGLYTGKTDPIQGSANGTSMNGTPFNLGTSGTNGTAQAAVHIDWNGIVNQNALPANYTGTWPTSTQMNAWPVVRYNGDLSLPGDGQGVLIVTGNLTINGNKTWKGIVLVGGYITGNGDNTILGALVTGLNVKLGTPVSTMDPGNGTKTYQYSSCDLLSALKPLGSLVRVRNGWMDNTPTW